MSLYTGNTPPQCSCECHRGKACKQSDDMAGWLAWNASQPLSGGASDSDLQEDQGKCHTCLQVLH